MSTYRTTSRLSKPEGREKIPSGALAYLRTRNRMRVFSLIWKEFRKSGLTQAELAARLGKGTDRVCKILGGPGNWTLDTANDVLFAINGGILNYSLSYPLDAPKRNDILPHWVSQPDESSKQLNSPEAETSTDAENIQRLR